MIDLLRFKKDSELFCTIDFETECLNLSFNNKIWEGSILVATQNRIIERRIIYIKYPDGLNVSDGAAAITGFYNKVPLIERDGITPFEACNILVIYIYNPKYRIVGANILNFDIFLHNMLRKYCGLVSDYSYIPRVLDTNSLARAWKHQIAIPQDLDELQALQWKMSQYRVRGVKTSVGALCKDLGITVNSTLQHDALYDSELTLDILKKLIWEIELV